MLDQSSGVCEVSLSAGIGTACLSALQGSGDRAAEPVVAVRRVWWMPLRMVRGGVVLRASGAGRALCRAHGSLRS